MARKRGMQYIPYDYEAAYNKAMEDMHEWFIENLFQHRKKVIYALKEITAGDQFAEDIKDKTNIVMMTDEEYKEYIKAKRLYRVIKKEEL